MSAAALAASLAPFDATALAALASKGLVRRAERDLEAGLIVLRDVADGSAAVAADGETVRIGAAGPTSATCTCPASGICRHILAATLLIARRHAGAVAGGAEAAEPAPDPLAEILALGDAEIAKWAGRPALREAVTLLAGAPEPAIRIDGSSLAVRLDAERPEVVWPAGRGLAGLICKGPAAKRKALSAAAVLAVRRAHGLAVPGSFGEEAAASAGRGAAAVDTAFLDDVRAALRAYLRSGFSAAPASLEQRLEGLALSSRADALPRLAAFLRTLAARLREKRERTATADPEATLALLAESFALATALLGAGGGALDAASVANLRGRVREEFEPAGDLQLTGAGAAQWTTLAGARGVTAYFYAPERGRWYTATLARARNQDPSFRPFDAYRREAIWGTSTLAQLARSEVRLTGAAAAGDGRLSLGKGVRAEAAPAADIAEKTRDWPVSFDAWDALLRHLRAAAAPSLTGPRPARSPVLLRPRLVDDPYADPFTQRLIWPVADERGNWLALAVPDGAERDGLAAALAKLADRTRVACIAALATREGQAFRLQPFAVLRSEAPNDRFESLGLDDPGAPGSGATFFERLAKRARTALRGGPQSFAEQTGGASALSRAIADARGALTGIAELGGLAIAARHAERLAASGEALRDLGFDALGAALSRAARAAEGESERVLVAAYLLGRAEALTIELPLLERVP